MSEQLRESLSAVMDGEAGEFELKRVLNELSANEELRGTWERYHLVRSLLRRELGRGAPIDFTERLWARIEADDSYVETADAPVEGRVGRRWLGPATGVAVAAAVAFTVILGFNLTPSDTNEPDAVVAEAAVTLEPRTQRVSIVEDPNPSLHAYPSRLDMQRARSYMLHHAQHAALNEQGSVLPFAKVAAFETR
jgi:sigma-E factor negative regulatory protein RseA